MADDRSSLSVGFAHVPTGSGVEVRYLMDPRLFTAEGQGRMLGELLRDELRLLLNRDE